MNCLDCDYSYAKDINYDEYNPEDVIICSVDNSYIGYFDEAAKCKCRFSKEEFKKYEDSKK